MAAPLEEGSPVEGYQWSQETHDAILAGLPGGGIDRLTKLAMGNDNLITNPGLLDALNKGNATPTQASAINQYMAGLQAENQVKQARAVAGQKVVLSAYQRGALDAMGVSYSDVVATPEQAQQTLADQLSAKGYQLARDQNQNIIIGSDGKPVIEAKPQDKKHGFSFGRIIGAVGGGLLKGWNTVDASVVGAVQDLEGLTTKIPGAPAPDAQDTDAEREHYARLAGYDPNNLFSMIAYDASGKSHLAISHLATEWDKDYASATGIKGTDALDQAVVFSENPEAYRRKITQDPTLTPEQKADKLRFLSSDPFANLVRQVGGRTATIGNQVALGAGLDPVNDGKVFSYTSAGIDFGASLLLDPTILAGRVFKGVRLAQIGILDSKGAIDGERVKAIFTPLNAAGKLAQPFVAGVQRRWTNYLDQVKTLASDAGDVEKAAAFQKIHSQFPELEPLTEQFTGARQVTEWAGRKVERLDDGSERVVDPGRVVYGTAKPITTLEEAGDYLASKMDLATLIQGKAALETSLMPGATSMFGFRALRGTAAERLAGHSQKIDLRRLDQATSVLPSPIGAIDEDGKVIAARNSVKEAQAALDSLPSGSGFAAAMKAIDTHAEAAATATGAEHTAADAAIAKARAALQGREKGNLLTGELSAHLSQAEAAIASGVNPSEALASARRAALENPEIKGLIQNNMIRMGTADGSEFSLSGRIAARTELASRRLGSLLPRNTNFTLNDAATQEKIYRYGLLYMNKGDAALMAAHWATANEGERRALISALQQQTLHAAGYGYTETGRKVLDKVNSLNNPIRAALNGEKSYTQAFTHTGADVAYDPLLGRESHFALFYDQVQKEWTLPGFAQLQRDAQRATIFERTLGRGFTSQIADTLMHGFKMIQLAKPSTWTRNAIEGWANAAFRGEAAGGIRARALGTAVENKIRDSLKAQGLKGKELQAALEKASPLPPKTIMTRKLPHLIMGQWYRNALDKMMGDDLESGYILKLLDNPEEARRMMEGYGLQHLLADVDPYGQESALANMEAGLGSARRKFQITGFDANAATDGFDGATKYARALGIRLESNPEYSKLLLAAAKGDGNITPLLDHIAMSPTMENEFRQMRFGSLYQDTNGQWVSATSPAERQIALEQLVRRQVDDIRTYMTGKNGEWAQPIEDHFLSTGKVPDAKFIHENLSDEARPIAVESPVYEPVPLVPGREGFVGALFNSVDKAYVRMVENPIQRTTSMPLFMHSYGQARVRLANWEKTLVETHGFTPEAADALTKEAAMKSAWVKTESMIDDPGLKAQFDIVGRNFFAYSRAVQAMIRRWGQAMIQDPTRITKAALAVDAAHHSGMIWKDENGEWNFTFPGSGPLIHLLTDAMSKVPVLGGFAQIPTVPDLTGKVMLAMPGLENPFKLSATPLVNIPFRGIEKLAVGAGFDPKLPSVDVNAGPLQVHTSDHLLSLMDEIDRTVNGPIGAGQIISQFEPVALKKFVDALGIDDRNGMLASATIGALTNLIAGGHVPAQNSTTDEQDQFVKNVRTGVRNQLFLRAILGLWAPAAPSSPTNETKGSEADFAYQIQGIHGLDSEFKQLLNDTGGDFGEAAQIWTAMHPDKLIYLQSKSTSKANRAYLPATRSALEWTENNTGFIDKYSQIAGYFMPEYKGDFDYSAYALQLSIGLRQRNTPEEFVRTALTNATIPAYKQMTQKFDDAIAGAQQAGDDNAVKSLKDQRQAAVDAFNQANPLHKAMASGFEQKAESANNALAELQDLVNDPHAPAGVPKAAIADMLVSWNNYQNWKSANPGNTSEQADARTIMAAEFSKYMSDLAQRNGLTDLYKGVFVQLDNKLTDLSARN